MPTDKELKVRIGGDASQLGAESRKAVAALNEVQNAGRAAIAAFTGGLIGGGIAGALSGVVSGVMQAIEAAQRLLIEARAMGIDSDFLKGSRYFASRIGAPEDTVAQSIMNARRTRAGAQAGDENAAASLERLGLTLREIEGLQPDRLFERIADVFKDGILSKDRLTGLAGVIGLEQAQILAPYFAGGKGGDRLNLSELFRGDFSSWFLRNSSIYGRNISATLQGDRYKQNVEPISMYGVGDEEKAARMRDQIDQRRLAFQRSTLEIEEQIAAITEQRAELERRMAEESNVVKKYRLEDSILDLDIELERLQKQKDGRKKAPSGIVSAPVSADEFAQRGMFIGGQQRVPAILDKQLVELQTLVREMRETKNQQRDIWG